MSTIAFSLCTSQPGRYIFHEILQHKCLPRQQQRHVVRGAKELLDKWVQRLNKMGWIFLSVKFDIARLNIEWGIGTVSLLPHQTHLYIIKHAFSLCCEELQCAKHTPCLLWTTSFQVSVFPIPSLPTSLSLITCNSLVVWGPPLGGDMCTHLSIQGPHSKLPLLVPSHSVPLVSWPIALRARFKGRKGSPMSRGL